jgi:hypothetical protein
MQTGDYEKAYEIFIELGDYEDSADQAKYARYQQAQKLLSNKNYSEAMAIFSELGVYKDSATMVKECKYQYVRTHKNNTDKTTYSYLQELKSAGYKDSASIYNTLYAWKVTVLGWNSSSAEGNYKTSISKYNAVYCHLKLTGGPPDGSLKIKIKGTMPSGTKIDDSFSSAWEDGDTGTYYWPDGLYTYPYYGSTGYLYLYFYDTAGNLIGSSYVYIGI